MPVVLYVFENVVSYKEGHRLRVFKNIVLRIMFGPKREEVIGGWKDSVIESLIICRFVLTLSGKLNKKE
jgi:hypothetical protein